MHRKRDVVKCLDQFQIHFYWNGLGSVCCYMVVQNNPGHFNLSVFVRLGRLTCCSLVWYQVGASGCNIFSSTSTWKLWYRVILADYNSNQGKSTLLSNVLHIVHGTGKLHSGKLYRKQNWLYQPVNSPLVRFKLGLWVKGHTDRVISSCRGCWDMDLWGLVVLLGCARHLWTKTWEQNDMCSKVSPNREKAVCVRVCV